MRVSALLGRAAAALLGLALPAAPALAQARNPFSVGISEGGGSASGLTGWILAQQAWLEHALSQGVRAVQTGGAVWPLVGMSLVYGVFHAAGPGHGKAVLSSYMVANERALRRGIALSFAAALLQGCVAIALIGVMTLVLHATAARMKDAAALVETVSFAAIVLLGLSLVWRKGRALARAWRSAHAGWIGGGATFMPTGTVSAFALPSGGTLALGTARRPATRAFACEIPDVDHPADCRHCHAPDPRTLGGERFDWRGAAVTVLAAGLRPCSGAILVLVFAFAQGVFAAGVLAVLAMSVGVATTTAALASTAVLFKSVATRLGGRGSRRAALWGTGIEFAAACVVLAAGTLLLAGYAAALGGA